MDYILENSTHYINNTIENSTLSINGIFENSTQYLNGTIENSTEIVEIESGKKDQFGFWLGVGLSIFSSVFIGASFIIKKKALINLSREGTNTRANQGGYGYLKDFLWWAGLLSMTVGEAANFIAYAFAPASLVSTLGVLSVLVTTILASKFLDEKLNFLGKVGCFLCTIGSTIIVLHAPSEKEIASMDDLLIKISNAAFMVYVSFVVTLSAILVYHFRPQFTEMSTWTLLIWIGVCSLIGSLSVMSAKGFGLALVTTIFGDRNELTNWLTWFCLITLVVCICVQMNFLNKALDTFNTAVVTPIYYVFFTTCVIVASAILFREFDFVTVEDWIGLICGFSLVLTAIVLLHFCKQYNISLMKIAQQIQIVPRDLDLDSSNEVIDSSSCTIQLIQPTNDKSSYGTQSNL